MYIDDPLILELSVPYVDVRGNDLLEFDVRANRACELRILYVEETKTVEDLPTEVIGPTFLEPGETRRMPYPDSGFQLRCDSTGRGETMVAYCREGGLGQALISGQRAIDYATDHFQPLSRGLVIEKAPAEVATGPVNTAPVYNLVTAAAQSVETVLLPINFGFDNDQLVAAGQREALRLAEFLKANFVAEITIIGHTDDKGAAEFNLDLSLRHAENLAAFLVSDRVQTGIFVEGFGESAPPSQLDAGIYSIEEFRTIARRAEVSFAYLARLDCWPLGLRRLARTGP